MVVIENWGSLVTWIRQGWESVQWNTPAFTSWYIAVLQIKEASDYFSPSAFERYEKDWVVLCHTIKSRMITRALSEIDPKVADIFRDIPLYFLSRSLVEEVADKCGMDEESFRQRYMGDNQVLFDPHSDYVKLRGHLYTNTVRNICTLRDWLKLDV